MDEIQLAELPNKPRPRETWVMSSGKPSNNKVEVEKPRKRGRPRKAVGPMLKLVKEEELMARAKKSKTGGLVMQEKTG